jgi:cytochrome b6-f complex iron-sulfur subunit
VKDIGMSVAAGAAMSSTTTSRREFCAQAVSLVSIGTLLQGCGGNPSGPSNAPALPTVGATASGGAVAITIDGTSPLATVGSAALVQTGSGNFLVSRTGQETFTALTAVCTHEACTITGFQSPTFVCPCHGSEFTTSGAVARGPASAPLRQFATRFAANVLTITIA